MQCDKWYDKRKYNNCVKIISIKYSAGKGKVGSTNCPHCRGKRITAETKTMNIDVERGMRDGQQILFKGEGEQHPDYIPGNLIFTVR
jgi:DnaJ-class molecular chaperone